MESRVLLVHHRLHGDFNNAFAVARAIARKNGTTKVETVKIRLRGNIFLPFLRFALAKPYLLPFLWPFLFIGPRPRKTGYVAVVSTLAQSEAASAALSVMLGIPSFHIGRPKRIPARYFTVQIAHQGQEPMGKEIDLYVPPTRLTLEEARMAAAPLTCGHKCYALLIGGPSERIAYTQKYWDNLYKLLVHPTTYKWLITTSPRTPKNVVQHLRSIPNIELSIFDKNKESALPAYLGLSVAAFVTGESLSMLADAFACNIPVIGLVSDQTRNDTKISQLLTLWEGRGLLSTYNLDHYEGGDIALPTVEGDRPYWAEDFWRQIKEKGISL